MMSNAVRQITQHRPRRYRGAVIDQNQLLPDYVLLATVVGLTLFGLVMVYSSSFFIALNEGHSHTYYLLRQFIWALIGGVGLYVAQQIDYRFWRRVALPLFGITVALLILVLLLPTSMTSRGGAERWIAIGGFQFQPAEIAKFALIVYLAAWFIGRGDKLRSMTVGLIPFGLIVGLLIAIMFMQRNISSAMILSMIAITVYFAAGANLLHIGVGMLGASGVGWLLVQSLGHASARLQVFRDPWADPLGGGFQPIHSLYALASGGWFGRGLGQGRQKFLWLFSPHADAIYGVIGEELGLIGTLCVLGAFVLLAYRGYRIASRSTDPFAALLAIGITSWIVFQAFLNMAVISSLVPFTGQTLPFISYGGTSLAMCLFAMGVLLNVSKHTNEQHAEPVIVKSKSNSQPTTSRRPQDRAFSPLAPFMRRGDRGPRVSSPRGGVSFARTAQRSAGTVTTRGWRRLAQPVEQGTRCSSDSNRTSRCRR
jgi:cell division protein FtsW